MQFIVLNRKVIRRTTKKIYRKKLVQEKKLFIHISFFRNRYIIPLLSTYH